MKYQKIIPLISDGKGLTHINTEDLVNSPLGVYLKDSEHTSVTLKYVSIIMGPICTYTPYGGVLIQPCN